MYCCRLDLNWKRNGKEKLYFNKWEYFGDRQKANWFEICKKRRTMRKDLFSQVTNNKFVDNKNDEHSTETAENK